MLLLILCGIYISRAIFSSSFVQPRCRRNATDVNILTPAVVVQNRNMRVEYGLAVQDLEVLKVRVKELKKQLEAETAN